MKLSYQVIYKDVDNIVELCGYDGMSSYDRNACSAVLWKMVKFLSSRNAGLMAEFMQNTGCNFTDTLNWILANAFSIGTYKGNAQVGSQLRSRIIQSFRRLGSDSVYCLEKIYELLTEADADNRLIGLLWLYKEGMSFMTKKTSKKRDFDCYFKFFETIAKEKGFNEFKNIMSKIKMYENANYAAMYGNAVKLSTIHGAKGLEWKHVILLAYDNISFPDVDYMVSKQDISSIDMQAYIDGERRLAYVGITRAVDSLTIITDKDNMSLFGLEALGGYNQNTFDGSYLDFAKYVKSHNYTTPENMRLSESYTEFKYKKEE
jgi:superfamily I DNA/RNA helicase